MSSLKVVLMTIWGSVLSLSISRDAHIPRTNLTKGFEPEGSGSTGGSAKLTDCNKMVIGLLQIEGCVFHIYILQNFVRKINKQMY